MLSSKKKLISCLLQRITTDACRHVNPPQHTHQTQSHHRNNEAGAPSKPPPRARFLEKVWANFCCTSSPEAKEDNGNSRHEGHLNSHSSDNSTLQQTTKHLLQSLSKCELRHLWEAIQSGGRREGECVLVQRKLPRRLRHRSVLCDEQQKQQQQQQTTSENSPMLINCERRRHFEDEQEVVEGNDEDVPIDPRLRLSLSWRWPSLDISHLKPETLRPLPCCHEYILGQHSWHQQQNFHSMCINPYHWALLVPTDYTFEDVSSPTTNSLMSTAPVMPVDSPPVYHHDHDHQRFFKCDAPKVNDVAQASSSSPHHQYYYDPAPLSPPPSYHSEADSGELVFAPFAPQLVYVGQSDCKKSRLSPIRESTVARNNDKKNSKGNSSNSKWCRVAYWEFRERVGEMVHCKGKAVNVLNETADNGNAQAEAEAIQQINLQFFTRTRRHAAKPQSELARTRAKIGLGVSLFRSEDENTVWLYNRSEYTVFVSSRIFSHLQSSSTSSSTPVLSVMKVPPGHIIKAYDFAIAGRISVRQHANQTHNHTNGNKAHNKHHEHHEFSFSFVKGFGANYSRPDILQCPCWVEVYLDQPAKAINSRQKHLPHRSDSG